MATTSAVSPVSVRSASGPYRAAVAGRPPYRSKVQSPPAFVVCHLSFVLSGRTDLRTIAKSETPYVVTWGAQPNATFTLDAATKKNFKIEADGTGIKIIPCDGLKVFIR